MSLEIFRSNFAFVEIGDFLKMTEKIFDDEFLKEIAGLGVIVYKDGRQVYKNFFGYKNFF